MPTPSAGSPIVQPTSTEWRRLLLFAAVFAGLYFLPLGTPRFENAVDESLHLAHDYAREHVVLCLLPVFWIAGAIAAFVSQASVIRYLGPKANRTIAYGVASVSGTVLAVCSCTVLPLFAGIYRMGAGLGPASAFLYSGPAINVLAIVLTAKILGVELGLARAIAAVLFSVVLGLLMAALFRRDQRDRDARMAEIPEPPATRPLWQTALFFTAMVAVLVFANWANPRQPDGFFAAVFAQKWPLTATAGIAFAGMAWRWIGLPGIRILLTIVAVATAAFALPDVPELAMLLAVVGLAFSTAGRDGEAGEWFDQTWSYAKLIFPLLIGGVLVAGFLLGRPGHEALIPSDWIAAAVGGNSLLATLFAAVSGALMYFATLTEVPILQGLIGNGMGKGPALALLLAGPALSLPSMLVIASILGWKKTLTFALLVVSLATATGWVFGIVATN
ncbi:MAG: permease [Planctomycetes bacterium]|nr:permease [Planctomycetota bacterium]